MGTIPSCSDMYPVAWVIRFEILFYSHSDYGSKESRQYVRKYELFNEVVEEVDDETEDESDEETTKVQSAVGFVV